MTFPLPGELKISSAIKTSPTPPKKKSIEPAPTSSPSPNEWAIQLPLPPKPPSSPPKPSSTSSATYGSSHPHQHGDSAADPIIVENVPGNSRRTPLVVIDQEGTKDEPIDLTEEPLVDQPSRPPRLLGDYDQFIRSTNEDHTGHRQQVEIIKNAARTLAHTQRLSYEAIEHQKICTEHAIRTNGPNTNPQYEGTLFLLSYLTEVRRVTRRYLDAAQHVAITDHFAEHLYDAGRLNVDNLFESLETFRARTPRVGEFLDEVQEVGKVLDEAKIYWSGLLGRPAY